MSQLSTWYRTPSPSDAAAIDRLFKTVFSDTFGGFYRPDDLQSFLRKFTLAKWKQELESADFAFQLAQSQGVATAYIKLGPMSMAIPSPKDAMELRQLYVARDYRGSGVARELMEWGLAEARRRRVKQLYLAVHSENVRAQRFYSRFGFEAVGHCEFLVGTQADRDVMMARQLP